MSEIGKQTISFLNNAAHFSKSPKELLKSWCSVLDVYTLDEIMKSDEEWKNMLESDDLWLKLIKSDFGVQGEIDKMKLPSIAVRMIWKNASWNQTLKTIIKGKEHFIMFCKALDKHNRFENDFDESKSVIDHYYDKWIELSVTVDRTNNRLRFDVKDNVNLNLYDKDMLRCRIYSVPYKSHKLRTIRTEDLTLFGEYFVTWNDYDIKKIRFSEVHQTDVISIEKNAKLGHWELEVHKVKRPFAGPSYRTVNILSVTFGHPDSLTGSYFYSINFPKIMEARRKIFDAMNIPNKIIEDYNPSIGAMPTHIKYNNIKLFDQQSIANKFKNLNISNETRNKFNFLISIGYTKKYNLTSPDKKITKGMEVHKLNHLDQDYIVLVNSTTKKIICNHLITVTNALNHINSGVVNHIESVCLECSKNLMK